MELTDMAELAASALSHRPFFKIVASMAAELLITKTYFCQEI
jgi:hypothetical protein